MIHRLWGKQVNGDKGMLKQDWQVLAGFWDERRR
jgi:hypothetical protein